LNHWQQSALHVAAAIAERIIRRELSQTPEITLELIAEALQLSSGMTDVTVHVSPQDYANIGTQIHRLVNYTERLGSSSIAVDESISPGGCIVKTKFGQIDQQIESQLKRIEEELG